MPGNQLDTAISMLSAMSGDSQHGRLLRLAFPRDDGPSSLLLVNSLKGREEVSRCFRFEVELLSDDARIPLKALMAKMVTVSLVREDGSLRHFNGYVSEFRFLRTDGGFAFYQMVLSPWLAFTKLRMDSVSFHGKSIVELTEQTLANYRQADWHALIAGDDTRLRCANQHNETDYNHLHRRWEAAGLLYWYEHAADGHTLWLCDKSSLVKPVDAMPMGDPEEIPFRKKAGAFEDDGIQSWSAVRRMGSGVTTLASFDFKQPHVHRVSLQSRNEQGDLFPYERYENTGAYGFRDGDHGEQLARQWLEDYDGSRQYFEASGNDRTAQAGRSFRLGGHFSGEPRPYRHGETPRATIADRDYLILSVDHIAHNNYQTGKSAASHYENSFTCVRKDIPWRPGRHYNSEPCRHTGVQTAIVVGPEGSDIHTDGYGRVKVQFHWDRQGTYDENSSPWIRLLSPAAGGQFGHTRLPRVGEEVAVLYLDGNIDRPLVMGALYNGEHMPPWHLPDQQALAGLRSRELGGGSQGNQLVLDDTKGHIQAQLRSDHQHSQLSLGCITRIEGNIGRQDARGEGWELRTDGHGVARAAQGMLITTEARQAAHGKVKDMAETLQRLELAGEAHEHLAELALKNGAQDGVDVQGDVANALKAQHESIQGGSGDFPELGTPQLVLASSAGIAATTKGTLHLASEQHAAVTTRKGLSFAVGGSLFASIRQGLRLFAHKTGLRLVAAAGDIDMQALTDNIKLLAKLEITQTANRITISAKEEVVINGGGSYAKYSASGVELGTNGNFVVHAAKHSLVSAKNLEMAINMPPVAEAAGKGHGVLHTGSHAEASGTAWAGLPFKLLKDGALLEQGQIDDKGNIKFKHELDSKSAYELELPAGQSFAIDAGEYVEEHEVRAGVGFHGHENPGGSLSDEALSLEQSRLGSGKTF